MGGVLALGLGLAFALGEFEVDAVGQAIARAGLWGGLLIIGLMIVHTFIPFPAEVVALAAGAAFGVIWGTVFVWIGAMLGALVGFGVARWLGQEAVANMLPAKQAARLREWQGRNGASALLAARLVPLIAFNVINVAAGLSAVRLWTFLWTTALGIVPLTILMVWFGASMMALDWALVAAISVIGIAAILGLHWWQRRSG